MEFNSGLKGLIKA